MKILIVDDEVPFRSGLANFINMKIQAQVDYCDNGELALNACLKEKYDLILVDHSMPKMDGADFLNQIHWQKNPNQLTHKIIISSHSHEAYQLLENKDNLSLLSKPISPESLLSMIYEINSKNQVLESSI